MVEVQTDASGTEFIVTSESPLVYLDHWALRRISEHAGRLERFLSAFKTRGTLVFSLMNVVEIARDQDETRSTQIRNLLEGIGPHWAPMTIDAIRVIEAEETSGGADHTHPCVSTAFLSDGAFANRLANGALSLVHVVDLTSGENGRALREATDRDCERLIGYLQHHRDDHKADSRLASLRYPDVPFEPSAPTRKIYQGLVRLAITDRFRLDSNHVRDLYHAVCAVRCADLVTLDSHWVAQVDKLGLPPEFGRRYAEPKLDDFLFDLESWPATR